MNRYIIGLSAALLMQACDSTANNRDALAPSIIPTADPSIKSSPVKYVPSPDEQTLIDKLLSRHPGVRGESLRSHLTDPSVARIELSDPEDQAIVNKIFAFRTQAGRAGDFAARQTVQADQSKIYSVTLALVPSLGDNPNVIARVIRRKNPAPREVIVLSEGNLDPAYFGTALKVLSENRSMQGSPPSRDVRIDVEGVSTPAAWNASTRAAADEELKTLAKQKQESIPGVGRARVSQILARDK